MITFASPVWFWAFLSLPFLVVLYLHAERKRSVILRRLVAARLQDRLAGGVSIGKRRLSFLLTLLAFAFAILALSRPQFGFSWEERRDMGRDILIAVDTSRSMLATDLQPSRLKRAKLAAEDLLSHLKGDRVGIIAFAGSSFLQAPLTADFAATKDTLFELDTDIIPRGGTNLTEAITAANDAFGKGESDQRALIIFTDGEELEEDAVKAARDHKDKFRIFTVGLGSVDGALIPIPGERGGTQFVRDEKGEYVKSKLDEKRLREVAEAGGGFYVHLQNGPAEMKQIAIQGLGTMKEAATNESRFSKRPTERYQWPLSLAVACWISSVLIGERRRVRTVSIAAGALFLSVNPAFSANSTAAGELFARADFAGAAKGFEEQRARRQAPELDYNLGVSAYKAGDLDKAVEALSSALGTGDGQLQPKAAFSLANVLARRGAKHEKSEDKLSDWKNAVQHYERTLALDAVHPDAAHNRDLLKKLIEQLEQKSDDKKEEQKNKDEKKEEEKNQEEKDSGEGKSDEKKDGEKKDEGDKKGDSQKQPGDKGDEKKEGGEDGDKSQGEQKDGEGKQQDKKEGESKPGEQKKDGDKSDQPGAKPGDAGQEKDGEQKKGELKSANPGEKSDENQQQAAEAAEELAAAKEGRMTAKDAKQLLESMRQKERRVRLLDPRQESQLQNKPRPEKNW
jgi:Ca-activated chloride channel homolog